MMSFRKAQTTWVGEGDSSAALPASKLAVQAIYSDLTRGSHVLGIDREDTCT